jgi:glutathione S-transferase
MQKARQDLHNNLTVLEEHLSARTFIVGEFFSLADLSLFVAYLTIAIQKAVDAVAFRALG